ncbi:MAG: hypothetical protein WCW68_00815 [Methanothrix sp.]
MTLELELIEPVKSILSDVEAATGKPLKFVEKDDMNSFAAVKIARRSMPAHIVFYRKQHDAIINHLVAHECGHILRMFGAAEEKRLIPAKSRDDRAVLLEIEGDLNRISKLIPMKELVQVVGTWRNGLMTQLTNYPPDIMIEKWIYDGYPELRPYQLQSLERQNKQAQKGISKNVKMITPAKIYNSSNIMNYAFFNILGSYIKADLARPYRNTPFSNKGKQLIKLTEKDYVNTYEGDISMIDKWAEFLGLSKWYDWVGFEDVPLDYLNSV